MRLLQVRFHTWQTCCLCERKKLIDVSTISVLQHQLFLKRTSVFLLPNICTNQSINQLDEARNTQKNNQRTIYKKAGSSLKASVKKEKNVKKNKNCISYKSRTWPKTWCWNVLFLVSSLLPGVVFWREKKRIWSMVIHDTFNSFLNFSWPLSK